MNDCIASKEVAVVRYLTPLTATCAASARRSARMANLWEATDPGLGTGSVSGHDDVHTFRNEKHITLPRSCKSPARRQVSIPASSAAGASSFRNGWVTEGDIRG